MTDLDFADGLALPTEEMSRHRSTEQIGAGSREGKTVL